MKIEMPWADTTLWNPNEYYPMPVGFLSRNNPEYIIEGYGIFQLDPESNLIGDIIPAVDLPRELSLYATTFSVALAICELKNGRRMIGIDKSNGNPPGACL